MKRTMLVIPLLLMVHLTQGEVNLAQGKSATQSTNYSTTKYFADVAVDGVFKNGSDFSHTAVEPKGNQWWQVDLGQNLHLSKIKLYNREGFYERLAKITIFTSAMASPSSPSDWTNRSYQEEAYDAVGTILLNRQLPARFVRVHCAAEGGLAMQEVMVYEAAIFISVETATHSSSNISNPASAAIDGDLTTYFTTNGSSDHWWKAVLTEKTFFKKAAVFVGEPQVTGASYLTRLNTTSIEPIANKRIGWTECFFNTESMGEEYELFCHSDYTYIEEFAIYSEQPFSLREIQIFGYELPQLSKDVELRTESATTTSVTLSFLQWNSNMTGEKSPTNYRIKLNGNLTFPLHDPSTERVFVNFTGFSAGMMYTVEVKCMIYDDDCLGDQQNFTTQTTCAAPSVPVINESSCIEREKSSRQRWRCTITWQASTANCPGSVTYVINGKVSNKTTSHTIDIYVDGGEEYHIGMRARNSDGFYSERTDKSWTANELAPQFGSSTFTVTKVNTSCVMLTWQQPQFPGGTIRSYRYNCAKGGWRTAAPQINETHSCGYEPNTQVNCSLVARNSLNSAEILATGYTCPVDPQNSYGGKIAGAVIGVLLIVAAGCFAVYLVYRCRRVQKPSNDELELSEHLDLLADKRPGGPNEQGDGGDVQLEEDNDLDSNSQGFRSEPVLVEKLGWFISTNQEAISAQYADLKKIPLPPRTAALSPENSGKCRYRNLYPADKYRVKLQRDDVHQTDFINASYMKGYNRKNGYIASMGPFNEDTSCDFWLMTWQQNPSAIVMVTRAQEVTKMKCWQYWPLGNGKSKTFGEFSVTCKSTETHPDFFIRHLEVETKGEKRVIPHFNYLTWPDHGVPDIEVFVAFHRLVNFTVQMAAEQPLLVHCSAGVGRSGTYIALDYLIEQAKAEGMVDMYTYVAEMRKRRPSMIQTVEQYHLLHRALYESLTTETFPCSPSELQLRLSLHKTNTGEQTDIVSVEYQHILDRVNSLTLSYTSGKMPENQDKNRFSEILPCEDYRLFLSDGFEGNYINAVTFNGYRTKGQWIATQNPLSYTIRDFWELMLEQDVEIVVQLEGTQNPFYPLTDHNDMFIDPFTITRKSSEDGEHVKTVDILLQKDGVRPKEQRLKVLMAKNWTSEFLPPTRLFIVLQEVVEQLLQQTGSSKICVVCQDGSTRCGLYICVHNAIEKLKVEQQVNIYYPTVMAKLRRPQFIPTLEQYSYLYQVVNDYAEDFGDYANFG